MTSETTGDMQQALIDASPSAAPGADTYRVEWKLPKPSVKEQLREAQAANIQLTEQLRSEQFARTGDASRDAWSERWPDEPPETSLSNVVSVLLDEIDRNRERLACAWRIGRTRALTDAAAYVRFSGLSGEALACAIETDRMETMARFSSEPHCNEATPRAIESPSTSTEILPMAKKPAAKKSTKKAPKKAAASKAKRKTAKKATEATA